MAREMQDLILLDSVLRSSDVRTRANGALPAPGVSCQANVDRDLSFAGMRIGLPMGFWASLDPTVSLQPSPAGFLTWLNCPAHPVVCSEMCLERATQRTVCCRLSFTRSGTHALQGSPD